MSEIDTFNGLRMNTSMMSPTLHVNILLNIELKSISYVQTQRFINQNKGLYRFLRVFGQIKDFKGFQPNESFLMVPLGGLSLLLST